VPERVVVVVVVGYSSIGRLFINMILLIELVWVWGANSTTSAGHEFGGACYPCAPSLDPPLLTRYLFLPVPTEKHVTPQSPTVSCQLPAPVNVNVLFCASNNSMTVFPVFTCRVGN